MTPKNLKCMKLYWNFQRGGEVLGNIPFVWKVWIFSGITHSCYILQMYGLFSASVECCRGSESSQCAVNDVLVAN